MGGPSVLQIRIQKVLPEDIGNTVLETMDRFESELIQGSLVVVELSRSRVRILPL
jgi:predicted nuclease of predicted toxin-antitoxin system